MKDSARRSSRGSRYKWASTLSRDSNRAPALSPSPPSPSMLVLRSRVLSGRCLGRSVVNGYAIRSTCLPRPPTIALSAVRAYSAQPPRPDDRKEPKALGKLSETIRENIYTIPNLLTASRILACPILGYAIVQDNFVAATSLLVYAGLTDLVCLSLAFWCPQKTMF